MKNFNLKTITVLLMLSIYSSLSTAQTPAYVDFDAYEKLVAEVKEHRKTRLLTTQEFKRISTEQKVIVLDTRSDSMFAIVHIKGAIHLNFSDFTQANLAKIIPSPDYKILIYCNNNFNVTQVNSKIVLPLPFRSAMVTKGVAPASRLDQSALLLAKKSSKASPSKTPSPQPETDLLPLREDIVLAPEKPLTLALNIPTYINLYGYGYKNVYELSELVNTYDHIIEFEGTAVVK